MKLWSRVRLRSLRKRVRREVRASPALRRDQREARSGRKSRSGMPALRVLLTLGLLALSLSEVPVETVTIVLASWIAFSTILRGSQMQEQLLFEPVDPVFLTLPVAEEDVRRFRWRGIVRGSLLTLCDSVLVLVALGWRMQAGALPLVAAAGLGGLMWAASLGLLVAILRFWPRFFFAGVGMFIYGAGFIALIFGRSLNSLSWVQEAALPFLVWFVETLTPGGWVATVFLEGVAGGHGWAFCWLIPAVAAAATLPFTLRLLPPFPSHDDADAFLAVLEAPEVPDLLMAEQEDVLRVISAANEDEIRDSAWLDLPASEDPMAHWFQKGLNPRQRQIAALLLTPGRWTQHLVRGMFTVVLGLAMAWLLRWWSMDVSMLVIYATGVIAGLSLIPIFGHGGDGFFSARIGNRQAHIHVLLPVTYRELRGVMWKERLCRSGAAVPVLALYALVASLAIEDWAFFGLAMKGLALLLATQPLWIVFVFSAGTNDTSAGCLSQVGILAGGLLAIVALVPCVLTTILTADWLTAGLGLAGTAVISWLLESGYRMLYERQFFDQLTPPSPR